MKMMSETHELRREAEALAESGKHASWITVHAVMREAADEEALRDLFELPLVKEGIDNVCNRARHA